MSETKALNGPGAVVAPVGPQPDLREATAARDYGLPPSLAILLDAGLSERMHKVARLMASESSRGMVPAHLIGKVGACFAVLNMSLDWKLNPYFVAKNTYETPGGSIGHQGALVQAILERSNRFVGKPRFEYRGQWSTIAGRYKMQTSARGKEYPIANWDPKEEIGLGVIVHWQVKGEREIRSWPGENDPFWLTQCQPRNSPLWALDPKTQIAYLAIRRFANQAAPGVLGAASFDYEDLYDASDRATDVTPRPRPEKFAEAEDWVTDAETQTATEDEQPVFAVSRADGTELEFEDPGRAGVAFDAEMRLRARDRGFDGLESAWEDNAVLVDAFRQAGRADLAEAAHAVHNALLNEYRHDDRGAKLEAAKQEADRRAEAGTPMPVAPEPETKSATSEKADFDLAAYTTDGKVDWRRVAHDMIAKVKTTPPPDLAPYPNGPFRHRNYQILEEMRKGSVEYWRSVCYEIESRFGGTD